MHDLKTIMNRIFSKDPKAQSLYTQGELKRAQKALLHLGYRDETHHLDNVEDQKICKEFVKRDASGSVSGIVDLFLDKGNKTGLVQDGIVSIANDDTLIKKLGNTTTVRELAHKLAPKIIPPKFS